MTGLRTDPDRQFLRHALATLAYRGGKAIRGAPASYGAFGVSPGTRTPIEILAHIGDLFDWMIHLLDGQHVWQETPPLPWDEQVERFHRLLDELDVLLAADRPLETSAQRLFQGPVADALTHIGQIAMLRRIADSPVRGENYFKADIVAGRTGPDQTAPRREFD
jgi:hypothetical protein